MCAVWQGDYQMLGQGVWPKAQHNYPCSSHMRTCIALSKFTHSCAHMYHCVPRSAGIASGTGKQARALCFPMIPTSQQRMSSSGNIKVHRLPSWAEAKVRTSTEQHEQPDAPFPHTCLANPKVGQRLHESRHLEAFIYFIRVPLICSIAWLSSVR
jgi:hypothetical protein